MPLKKRPGQPSRTGRQTRPKRVRTSELTATDPPVPEPPINNPGLVSLDVNALSATISTAISQAVKTALSKDNLNEILRQNTLEDSTSIEVTGHSQADLTSDSVTTAVSSHVSSLIGAGTSNDSLLLGPDNVQPKQIFTSVSVNLSSRVGSKIKAKIWANEYVEFGALLASTPQVDKYALSMTPSTVQSKQPRLTLEPYHTTKKVSNIQQWVSAFNTFVSVFTERYQSETPQLMKYCEVVRDIALSNGDWLWYDEQFRYLRQSAPDKYPWDQIHWELWLRASANFRRSQSFTNKPQTTTRQRFRSNFFPRGTCWAFHAGKHCQGCQFEHVCYKCGAKHPAIQCSVPATQQRSSGVKPKGNSPQASGPSQPASNPRKGGTA